MNTKAKQSARIPANNVGMSGRVNKIGSRKITPVTKPIGIDHESAIGSCTEGLCTSSAMLATFFFFMLKVSKMGQICSYEMELTHSDGSIRIR